MQIRQIMVRSKLFILVLLSVVLTSCKRVIVTQENDLANPSTYQMDLWAFMENSLLDTSFFLWLVIDFFIALFVWINGYRVLEWFKRCPMSVRVVITIVCLLMLFIAGCISHDINSQHYGAWFALPVAMAIGSTILVVWSIIKRYRYRFYNEENRVALPEASRRQKNLIFLANTMFWVWSCGWVVYFIAISIGKQPHVGAEVLLRSAVASLDLFLMDIDSNILDAIQNHDILKGMIACISFAAVICTAILIMSLILSRMMAYMHIKHIKVDDTHNHVYIFFGLNDASKLLSKDIYKKDNHSIIIFVENSLAEDAEQDDDKTDGWKNIVSLLTHRQKTFADVEEDERRALAIANCSICSLDGEIHDILGNIGLETVKKILQDLNRVQDGTLDIFFLSEDRESNVRSTSMLAKDSTIGSKLYQTTIHCHARRNGINKIIEDMGITSEKRIEVKIIDSSHLAVEFLKSKVCNHPVNFVDVETLSQDNPGAVCSEFTSLIVGMGETGQDALSFLYEFGAFVDKNASEYKSYRSPFRCHVVDIDIERLEGNLIASLPGVSISNSRSIKDSLINLYPYSNRSTDFYDNVLSKIATKLNYVVVAVGDDEVNMSIAVDILRYVRSRRDNLDHFCIYVRAYEKGTFKHLKEIAKHYNERLGETKIVLFGHNEEIYTYELIVQDKYEENGKLYYETYRSLSIDPNPDNDEGTWEERHKRTLSKAGNKWNNMSKLRRKENQDRSNALHSETKLKLLEKAVGKDHANAFIDKVLGNRTGRKTDIKYHGLSNKENKLMLNLAMCEHLRWNAAHEMLGYVNNDKDHKCDDIKKKHNCLKPWEQLDSESDAVSYIDDYKTFDFGVVETTFYIKKNGNT